jgi:dTDP-4-amino-4,6-dideoxygalactose transaminase
MAIWNRYHEAFADLAASGRVRRPMIPANCEHNAHMYYLLLDDLHDRTSFIQSMKADGINCVFDYVPLHSAPQGLESGRVSGKLQVTSDLSERLVRLPLWIGLEEHQDRVIGTASRCFLDTLKICKKITASE